MQLKVKILLVLMLLLVGSTGCSLRKTVILYPITNSDFAYIQKGEPSPIEGYVMSEFYLTEVLEVKLKGK